jgi:hypothetical protein
MPAFLARVRWIFLASIAEYNVLEPYDTRPERAFIFYFSSLRSRLELPISRHAIVTK